MTRRAEEAETIKEGVEKVRDKAQALVNDIAKDKSLAEEKLEAARPALEEAEAALNTIKPAHIGNCPLGCIRRIIYALVMDPQLITFLQYDICLQSPVFLFYTMFLRKFWTLEQSYFHLYL